VIKAFGWVLPKPERVSTLLVAPPHPKKMRCVRPIIQFDFTGSVRNRSLEAIKGGSSITEGDSLTIFHDQSQLSNRLGNIFFKFSSCLIDEGFILRLGFGDPHFYMRCAIYPILKGMGQHNLRGARARKKRAYGKIVERTPIEHLFDDRAFPCMQ
jgi:hypothetical protein